MQIELFDDNKILDSYDLQELVPAFVRGMIKHEGKEKAIKGKTIVESMQNKGYKITESKLRKICHHVREKGILVTVVANNHGYYYSQKEEDIKSQIEVLQNKANSLLNLVFKMKNHLNKINK